MSSGRGHEDPPGTASSLASWLEVAGELARNPAPGPGVDASPLDESPVEDLRSSEQVLRQRVHELEAELQRYREQEREVGAAWLDARRAAVSVREEARREAQAVLRKARARAADLVEDAVRDRERTERELARQRALAGKGGQRLVDMLQEGLERLRTLSSPEEPPEPFESPAGQTRAEA